MVSSSLLRSDVATIAQSDLNNSDKLMMVRPFEARAVNYHGYMRQYIPRYVLWPWITDSRVSEE